MHSFTRRHFLRIALLLVLSFAAVQPFRAADPLPDKLSDEAFWKMIGDFSEEGGYFRFENFLSNELGFQYVIPELKEMTKPGGVYLGVGPEQNFTYIVGIEPKMAFITDIRRQNMLELMMYKGLFELSPDRADFLSRLFARKRPEELKADATADELFGAFQKVQPDLVLYRKNLDELKKLLLDEHKFRLSDEDVMNIEYVYHVFTEAGPDIDYQVGGGFGGGATPTYMDLMTINDGQGKNRSFLATDENYQLIRKMQMKNLIVPLVGDFGGPKALRAVGQYLRDHDATVTAFYLSNVEQYLFQDSSWRRFYGNVATLPLDSSSQFIRSINGGGLTRGQFRGGYNMRFQSFLSPMTEMVKAFQDGRIRYYNDVINMTVR